jgi:predicted ArsR family transcriptional regulator
MTVQSVTIELPQSVYKQIEQAAQKRKRPLDQLLVEAVTAVAPVLDTAPIALHSALAQMAYLNDAALWQAARTSMPPEQRTRLEELHDKAQREGLTPEEEAEEEALLKLYRETLLVRAQAAVLLSQRQYDVSDPSQFQL